MTIRARRDPLERALIAAFRRLLAAIACAACAGWAAVAAPPWLAALLAAAVVGVAWGAWRLQRRVARAAGRAARQASHGAALARRWRDLCDLSSDALILESPSREIQLSNRRFGHFFPNALGNAGSARLEDWLPEAERTRRQRIFERCLRHRRLESEHEVVLELGDGCSRTLRAASHAYVSGGEAAGVFTAFRDVTERRLEQIVRRSMSQRLDFLVQEMPLGCIVWDDELAVLDWNREAENIFGWAYTEAFRREYAELLVPERDRGQAAELREELLQGRAKRVTEARNVTRSGETVECEWFHTSLLDENEQVVGVASMVRDVTRQRSVERKLAESQRMDAISQLASGVVHDFNNFLQSISGHVTLARMRLGPASVAEKSLEKAEAAAGRAADLVKRLLTLSRQSTLVLQETDLNEAAREAAQLFAANVPARVRLELELHPAPVIVLAERTQIEQVLINLLANARDAMDREGVITIRTHPPGPFEDSRCGGRGDYVAIEVEDTGRGMDLETRARIFQPFFSSKAGRSRGLGLTSVQAIVAGYDGVVSVDSEPGKGSRFTVYLPATNETGGQLRAGGGRERGTRILVADDTEAVLELIREILDSHGYAVTCVADGAEAIELLQAGEAFDLILADMDMPRQRGTDVLKAARSRDLRTPVILSSGHGMADHAGHAGAGDADAFLAKPYRPDELLRLVRRILDSARGAKPLDEPAWVRNGRSREPDRLA